MIQLIKNHLKNIGGWTTNRKLVCFAVDDYGNVRVNDKKSLDVLLSNGLEKTDRFDQFDSLCTKEDYLQLFKVLKSVKDKNSNPAIFTTYALSSNIDFKKVLSNGKNYEYELLPATYQRLEKENHKYKDTWNLVLEGINSKLIKPQFHGREHLNIKLFEYHLRENTDIFRLNLENNSYAGIPKAPKFPTIGFTQSFSFWDESEVEKHKEIIKDGLTNFEKVYGYKSITFTPPAQQLHPKLYKDLEALGVKSIDKPRKVKRHLGQSVYALEVNKLGIKQNQNHVSMVRNVVFEPSENRVNNWVNYTFDQVEAAFRTKKPAIISSHRVNFCGHISPENRDNSLTQLEELLNKIASRYPDVEFISVDQLAKEIINTNPSQKISSET